MKKKTKTNECCNNRLLAKPKKQSIENSKRYVEENGSVQRDTMEHIC